MIKIDTIDILHRQVTRYRCDECGGGPMDRVASGGGLDYRPFSVITGTIGDDETGGAFRAVLCSACIDEIQDLLGEADRWLDRMDARDRARYQRRIRQRQERIRRGIADGTVIGIAGSGASRKMILQGGREVSAPGLTLDHGRARRVKRTTKGDQDEHQ